MHPTFSIRLCRIVRVSVGFCRTGRQGAFPCLSIVRLSTRVDDALRHRCSMTGYDYFKNSYVTRSVGIGTLDH
jgi:hypothetical protein